MQRDYRRAKGPDITPNESRPEAIDAERTRSAETRSILRAPVMLIDIRSADVNSIFIFPETTISERSSEDKSQPDRLQQKYCLCDCKVVSYYEDIAPNIGYIYGNYLVVPVTTVNRQELPLKAVYLYMYRPSP